MVGYDGSEPATGALRFAAARAGEDGRILVVYAVQPSDDAWRGTSTYAQLRARSAEEAEAAVLDRARRELSSSKVEGYWILEGAAAPALRETAVAFKADEIVVGSRGLSRLRTSLGSVCHALLPGLDRSLTVVTPLRRSRSRGPLRSERSSPARLPAMTSPGSATQRPGRRATSELA